MQDHAEIIIGHVRLTVANIERSLAFYCDLIGLEKREREGELTMLFPGVHQRMMHDPPHRALFVPEGHMSLHHFSFLYFHKRELARVVKRFIDTAYEVDGAFDYGIVRSMYFRDPDGIPVELYIEYQKDKKEGQQKEEVTNVQSLALAVLLKELQLA